MTRRTPNYGNRDDLHADLQGDINIGGEITPPLQQQFQSGFNLPRPLLNRHPDQKMGFVAIAVAGTPKSDHFDRAISHNYTPINAKEYPELLRTTQYAFLFGDKQTQEGEFIPHKYGEQIAMMVSKEDYDYEHAPDEKLRKQMEDELARSRKKSYDEAGGRITTY